MSDRRERLKQDTLHASTVTLLSDRPEAFKPDEIERRIVAAESAMFTLRSELRDDIMQRLIPWRKAFKRASQ